MDLSRKIILASCIGFSFLAYGIGCSVEDRDIERAGVFVCRTDADCLKGSECVKSKKDDAEGKCARSDEIKHCLDNDGDRFIGVSVDKSDSRYAAYVTECGFSSKNLQDVDDNDPLVYPDAPELCDGKDNSGDGCVDGICTHESGSCVLEGQDAYCEPITEPCWGSGNVRDYDNSVCAAALIGYMKCVSVTDADGNTKASLTYIAPTSSSSSYTGTECPSNGSDIPGYKDTEDGDLMCDGKDNNCNGSIDEGCVICHEDLEENEGNKYADGSCVATLYGKIYKGAENYNLVKDYCDTNHLASCDCLGHYKCPTDDKGNPVCTNDKGVNLEAQELSKTDNPCVSAFTN